jgi:hypothetical protein
LPKDKSAAQAALLMGEMKAPESPKAFQLNPNLERALDNLKRAIGKAEAQRGGRGS